MLQNESPVTSSIMLIGIQTLARSITPPPLVFETSAGSYRLILAFFACTLPVALATLLTAAPLGIEERRCCTAGWGRTCMGGTGKGPGVWGTALLLAARLGRASSGGQEGPRHQKDKRGDGTSRLGYGTVGLGCSKCHVDGRDGYMPTGYKARGGRAPFIPMITWRTTAGSLWAGASPSLATRWRPRFCD